MASLPLVRATLEAASGGFVTGVYLPPFDTMPHVVTWGTRTFVKVEDAPADVPTYRECFAYAVVLTG